MPVWALSILKHHLEKNIAHELHVLELITHEIKSRE